MMMYFVVVVMDFPDVRFFFRLTEEKSPNASRANSRLWGSARREGMTLVVAR
jgi:hypothetical protein